MFFYQHFSTLINNLCSINPKQTNKFSWFTSAYTNTLGTLLIIDDIRLLPGTSAKARVTRGQSLHPRIKNYISELRSRETFSLSLWWLAETLRLSRKKKTKLFAMKQDWYRIMVHYWKQKRFTKRWFKTKNSVNYVKFIKKTSDSFYNNKYLVKEPVCVLKNKKPLSYMKNFWSNYSSSDLEDLELRAITLEESDAYYAKFYYWVRGRRNAWAYNYLQDNLNQQQCEYPQNVVGIANLPLLQANARGVYGRVHEVSLDEQNKPFYHPVFKERMYGLTKQGVVGFGHKLYKLPTTYTNQPSVNAVRKEQMFVGLKESSRGRVNSHVYNNTLFTYNKLPMGSKTAVIKQLNNFYKKNKAQDIRWVLLDDQPNVYDTATLVQGMEDIQTVSRYWGANVWQILDEDEDEDEDGGMAAGDVLFSGLEKLNTCADTETNNKGTRLIDSQWGCISPEHVAVCKNNLEEVAHYFTAENVAYLGQKPVEEEDNPIKDGLVNTGGIEAGVLSMYSLLCWNYFPQISEQLIDAADLGYENEGGTADPIQQCEDRQWEDRQWEDRGGLCFVGGEEGLCSEPEAINTCTNVGEYAAPTTHTYEKEPLEEDQTIFNVLIESTNPIVQAKYMAKATKLLSKHPQILGTLSAQNYGVLKTNKSVFEQPDAAQVVWLAKQLLTRFTRSDNNLCKHTADYILTSLDQPNLYLRDSYAQVHLTKQNLYNLGVVNNRTWYNNVDAWGSPYVFYTPNKEMESSPSEVTRYAHNELPLIYSDTLQDADLFGGLNNYGCPQPVNEHLCTEGPNVCTVEQVINYLRLTKPKVFKTQNTKNYLQAKTTRVSVPKPPLVKYKYKSLKMLTTLPYTNELHSGDWIARTLTSVHEPRTNPKVDIFKPLEQVKWAKKVLINNTRLSVKNYKISYKVFENFGYSIITIYDKIQAVIKKLPRIMLKNIQIASFSLALFRLLTFKEINEWAEHIKHWYQKHTYKTHKRIFYTLRRVLNGVYKIATHGARFIGMFFQLKGKVNSKGGLRKRLFRTFHGRFGSSTLRTVFQYKFKQVWSKTGAIGLKTITMHRNMQYVPKEAVANRLAGGNYRYSK